jgi:hypothetical protein
VHWAENPELRIQYRPNDWIDVYDPTKAFDFLGYPLY